MKKAGEVWGIKGMNQAEFEKASNISIQNAKLPEERYRRSLEVSGGDCPSCGKGFDMRHCNKFGSDYSYYVPGCSCFEEQKIRLTPEVRAFLQGHIPLKYWSMEFDNLRYDLIKQETRESFKKAREYCENRRHEAERGSRGIFLYGTIGSGKTLSAVLIAKWFIREKLPVIFLSMPDFIDSIMNARKTDFIEQSRQFPVVVLDDLTKKIYPEGMQSELHKFINYLDENRKIVIITDERHPKELDQYILGSTYSRISGLTGGNVICFQGDDFRPKEREL